MELLLQSMIHYRYRHSHSYPNKCFPLKGLASLFLKLHLNGFEFCSAKEGDTPEGQNHGILKWKRVHQNTQDDRWLHLFYFPVWLCFLFASYSSLGVSDIVRLLKLKTPTLIRSLISEQ